MTGLPVAGGASAVLTIDVSALAANWRFLQERAAPARAAAVIKANGYGLGLEKVAQALHAAGCRMFFVAHPHEGVRARTIVGGDARIYVLNGLQATSDPRDYAACDLSPVIGAEEELARWQAFDAKRPFALHLDTGMNRLGFASLETLMAALARHGGAGADLLMSHFVSSERPDDPLNALQIARFAAARAALPHLEAALGNSSGIFVAGAECDWVRPGYALYGGNPTPGRPNPMQTVVTLDVVVQQTRWIAAGESCGYNSQWTARRPTRLATLLAGYADGLPRGAGATDSRAGANVIIAGRPCPLVGRVSMDLTIADVTDVPDVPEAAPGGWARFLGPDAPLDDFAQSSGTIGYNVLTSLGTRYERVIVG